MARVARGASRVDLVDAGEVLTPSSPTIIDSWHAHVYFDAATRNAALALRDLLTEALVDHISLGRFHERPVGPHPAWSFQLEFGVDAFAHVVGWLALNRGSFDVFIHPNTDDMLKDHRDRALWMGHVHRLDLRPVGG